MSTTPSKTAFAPTLPTLPARHRSQHAAPNPRTSPRAATSTPAHRHLHIFGPGYVCGRLANEMIDKNWHVTATSGTQSRAEELSHLGIPTAPAVDKTFTKHQLQHCTHVLSAVPPAPADFEDPVLQTYGQALLHAPHLRWLGYLSSTSVYGAHGGARVDERSASIRPGARGRARLRAEAAWRATSEARAKRAALYVFRLAGVYGPRRSALETLRRSPDVLRDSEGTADMFVSRVHVRDITAALAAALARDVVEEEACVINIADDAPATRRCVFTFAEDVLSRIGDVAPARGVTETGGARRMKPSARDRDRGSKRVANDKMKSLLLPQLAYPTYREGLLAIARETFDERAI